MSEISQERIYAFEQQLYLEEKSRPTVKKYVLAIRRLAEYLEGEELSKQRLLQYREKLLGTKKRRQSMASSLQSMRFWIFAAAVK